MGIFLLAMWPIIMIIVLIYLQTPISDFGRFSWFFAIWFPFSVFSLVPFASFFAGHEVICLETPQDRILIWYNSKYLKRPYIFYTGNTTFFKKAGGVISVKSTNGKMEQLFSMLSSHLTCEKYKAEKFQYT